MRPAPAIMLMIAGAALVGGLLTFVPGGAEPGGMPLNEFVACGIRVLELCLHVVVRAMQS